MFLWSYFPGLILYLGTVQAANIIGSSSLITRNTALSTLMYIQRRFVFVTD